MLSSFTDSIKTSLGTDLNTGLLGMFLFLHFYYGLAAHSWADVGRGAGVTVFTTFLLVTMVAMQGGRGLKATLALIMTALAIDFFSRGQLSQPATLAFDYLGNGPAVVNFASFGFAAVWLYSVEPAMGFDRP